MTSKAVIALLTDFGTADYFVAAMKGVILSAVPSITIVDVTHEIPPHDIGTAAFTLLACYRDFPPGTIHVCVVDPGVGSTRRPIAIRAGGYSFVGPDNGLFSYILDREVDARVFHLTERSHFRGEVSTTFHGRDIFAPVAAALASGTPLELLGPAVSDPVRLQSPARCSKSPDGGWNGAILHIDRFGNCVTNITRESLPPDSEGRMRLDIGGRVIRRIHRCYSETGTLPGEVFAIWGSAGFLELSIRCASAARRLGVTRGECLRVKVPE